MSLDFWSPALAPPLAPGWDDDAPDCLSRLYVPAGSLSLGPLVCSLDHRASGLPDLHGTVLAGHGTEWTTAEAAASEAEYRATAAARPLCTDCNTLPQSTRGLCASCAATELAGNDIETESEAA